MLPLQPPDASFDPVKSLLRARPGEALVKRVQLRLEAGPEAVDDAALLLAPGPGPATQQHLPVFRAVRLLAPDRFGMDVDLVPGRGRTGACPFRVEDPVPFP